MEKPYTVVFGGVPGVSKTPIAHHLSCEFGLPILNTDQIRYEVREDLRLDSINRPGGIEEYEKRQFERFSRLLATGKPFIFDGSMDREWSKRKTHLLNAGYDWFMINIELSRPFLVKLYNDTDREWAVEYVNGYLAQHQDFIKEFSTDINVEINDRGFADRLQIAANGLKNFLLQRKLDKSQLTLHSEAQSS